MIERIRFTSDGDTGERELRDVVTYACGCCRGKIAPILSVVCVRGSLTVFWLREPSESMREAIEEGWSVMDVSEDSKNNVAHVYVKALSNVSTGV